jgi:hypothetical protein
MLTTLWAWVLASPRARGEGAKWSRHEIYR